MMKFIHNRPITPLLFIGGLAVVFLLLKFILFPEPFTNIVYVSEFIAYLLIILLVYTADYKFRQFHQKTLAAENNLQRLLENTQIRETQLLKQISLLENKSQTDTHTSISKEQLTKLFQAVHTSKNIKEYSEAFLPSLASSYEIGSALLYWLQPNTSQFVCTGRFAISDEQPIHPISVGEGLGGEAIASKREVIISNVPSDYFETTSSLGTQLPMLLYFLPIMKENDVIGLLEIASLHEIDVAHHWHDINAQLVKTTNKLLINWLR
jgi:hypothetical protein